MREGGTILSNPSASTQQNKPLTRGHSAPVSRPISRVCGQSHTLLGEMAALADCRQIPGYDKSVSHTMCKWQPSNALPR